MGWTQLWSTHACLFARLSICMSICLSNCLSICLSNCLFICLSICLTVWVPACLFVCAYLDLCVRTNRTSELFLKPQRISSAKSPFKVSSKCIRLPWRLFNDRRCPQRSPVGAQSDIGRGFDWCLISSIFLKYRSGFRMNVVIPALKFLVFVHFSFPVLPNGTLE